MADGLDLLRGIRITKPSDEWPCVICAGRVGEPEEVRRSVRLGAISMCDAHIEALREELVHRDPTDRHPRDRDLAYCLTCGDPWWWPPKHVTPRSGDHAFAPGYAVDPKMRGGPA